MSFPESTIEAIFANKKDKNYVEVLSHYSYLESFVLSDVKSVGLRIPETIIVEHGGNLKSWMFNSKKDEELPILKKRAEKVNPAEIFNSFSRRKGGNSSKSRPATTMTGMREYTNEPRAIVRYINGVVDSLDMVDFQDYLQTGLGYLKIIQQPIAVKSKSNYNASETYYCEYRHDDPLMPASFRFVKKVLQYSNPEENIASEKYKSKVLFKGSTKAFPDATSSRDGQSVPGFSNTKEIKIQTKLIKKNSETFFRVFDTATNQKLEKLTTLYASYLTQSFKFVIKKLICKFTMNEFNEIYFMGAAELYVTVKENSLYEGGRSVQLDEMVTTMKRHNKEQAALIMLANDDEPKKKSNKMLAEECIGDFCEFISLDSMKLAELASGHNVSKYFKKDSFAGSKNSLLSSKNI